MGAGSTDSYVYDEVLMTPYTSFLMDCIGVHLPSVVELLESTM